jgi:aspartate/methionine/tyrosine aminotransferase
MASRHGLSDDHLTRDTKLIVTNPHNPTGHIICTMSTTLVAKAQACGAYIFSDEMYWMLEMDPAQRLPSVCDLYVRGITLSGLSKAYGLPGLRIGWLATRDALMGSSSRHDYTTICGAPSGLLALALRADPSILDRISSSDISRLAERTSASGRRSSIVAAWAVGGVPKWLHAGERQTCRGARKARV